MSRVSELLNNPTDPAPRPLRRRVGVAVVILLAALTGWAIFKHAATGNLTESKIQSGIDHLTRGIESGDAASFEQAERHFIDAASVSVTDTYPAFLIHASRKMREPSANGGAHDAIATAIATGQHERAGELVAEFGADNARAAEYWKALLDEIALRTNQRAVQSVSSDRDVGRSNNP